MLCLLILSLAIWNVKCDIKLSDTEMFMEVGEIKSFQVEMSNASSTSITNTFLLKTQQASLVEVISSNLNVNLNGNSDKFSYDIKLKARKAGKSNVFASTGSLVATVEGNDGALLLVKVYKNEAISWVSVVLGWCYFIAWSLSFYPQLFTNYWNRSVVGLSFDFVLFNIYGYVMYTAFNMGMFFVPAVKEQYSKRHPGSPLPVQVNDLIFAAHGLILTFLIILQCIAYEKASQTVSTKSWVIMATYLIATATFISLALMGILLWVDVLYLFSYTKLFVTVSKYSPQVYLNYQRKSTKGWSIGGVALDFIGGVLSIHQMVLNGYNYGDWAIIVENPTKFGLGVLSIIYALISVVQHFYLYNDRGPECKAKTELDNVAVELTKVATLKGETENSIQRKLNQGVVLIAETLNKEALKNGEEAINATKFAELSAIPEESESEIVTGVLKTRENTNGKLSESALQKALNDGIMFKLVKITKTPKETITEELHDEIVLEVASIVKSAGKSKSHERSFDEVSL